MRAVPLWTKPLRVAVIGSATLTFVAPSPGCVEATVGATSVAVNTRSTQ